VCALVWSRMMNANQLYTVLFLPPSTTTTTTTHSYSWMAAAGLPRDDVVAMVSASLDALYEVEERGLMMQEQLELMEQQQQQQSNNQMQIGNGNNDYANGTDGGTVDTANAGESEFGTFAAGNNNVNTASRASLGAAADGTVGGTANGSRGSRSTVGAVTAPGGSRMQRSNSNSGRGTAKLTKGASSRAGSSAAGAATGANGATSSAIVESTLPTRLNLKQLDQAVTALCMQMLLEGSQEQVCNTSIRRVIIYYVYLDRNPHSHSNSTYHYYHYTFTTAHCPRPGGRLFRAAILSLLVHCAIRTAQKRNIR
jgi:hypothetical protein